MESVGIYLYLIAVIGAMAFIAWKFFGFIFGLQERKNEEKFQQLKDKRNEYINSISPIIKENYLRLTKAIIDKYPLVNFNFPSINEILEGIPISVDTRMSLKSVVDEAFRPIITISENDYLNANLAIMNVYDNSTEANSLTVKEKNKNNINEADPPDWQKIRELVYERDNHSCKRCGTNVELKYSHTHHLIRRSQGGDHSLNNLITLCRDCHSLMSGHSPMQGFRDYYISTSGIIHCSEFCAGINATKTRGSLTYLEHQGYTPCSKCQPEKAHFKAISDWEPYIKKFSTEQLLLILNNIN